MLIYSHTITPRLHYITRFILGEITDIPFQITTDIKEYTDFIGVKINIHELLLENRNEAVESGASSWGERIAWKAWKKAMLNRGMMNAGNSTIKNWVVNSFVIDWKKNRSPLVFPKKSFNQMWVEMKGKN